MRELLECRDRVFRLLKLTVVLWVVAAPMGLKAEVQIQTAPAAADTYIKEAFPDSDPVDNDNYGTSVQLELRSLQRHRALLRFEDLEANVPPGSYGVLASAFVELTISSAGWIDFLNGGDLALHTVTEAWTETGATWNCPDDPNASTGSTFPGCFFGTGTWGTEGPNGFGGGAYEPMAADVVRVTGFDTVVRFDVREEVDAILDGGPNHGWMVKLVDETTGDSLIFHSREAASGQPVLELGYDVFVDSTAPLIRHTAPLDGGFEVRGPRPELTVEVEEGGSGLASDLAIVLDGVDITSTCVESVPPPPPPPPDPGDGDGVVAGTEGPGASSFTSLSGAAKTGTFIYTCTPTADLAAGPHTLDVSISDVAGNLASSNATFELLLGPGPHVRELTALEDATILAESVTENRGSALTLEVQDTPVHRSLVDFDLLVFEDLVAQTAVEFDQAALELFVESATNLPGPLTVAPYRVLEDWVESEVVWSCALGLSTEGECPRPWTGGNAAATAESTATVDVGTTGTLAWVVTQDLSGGLLPAGTPQHPLFGWLLRFDPEVGTPDSATPPSVSFTSREGLAGQAPTLTITFSTPLLGDETPPEVVFTAPPATTANPSPPVSLTFTDDQSGVDPSSFVLTLDEADITESCTVTETGADCTTPVLTEASHVLSATLADLAGNVATVDHTFQVSSDTGPPVLTLVSPAGTVYNDTAPTVEVAYSDDTSVDTSTFSLTLDGVDVTANCTVGAASAVCATSGLAEGTHTLVATVADTVGQSASETFTFEVVLDTTAPTLSITAPTGTVVDDTTPAVTLSFSDDNSGVEPSTLAVAVDGFDITASCVVGTGTATCEPPALGQGDHTVSAEIADLAGNVATASQTFTLDLNLTDTVPPSLSVAAPGATVTDDPAPTITVSYSDAESDVDLTTLTVAVDGFELVAGGRCTIGTTSASCTPPLLGSGPHTVSAAIEDLAGNPATATSGFDLSYTTPEAVAPVVAITEPAETTVFDDLTPQITVTYSDAAVAGSETGVAILTLAVDVDGTDITAGCVVGDASAVCEPPPLTVGTHVVTATAEDLHGNVGTASFGFDIALTNPDVTAPAIAIAEPSTTPVNTDVVPIRVTYSDGETGIDLASLVITLDTTDITATCDAGPTEATCTSPVLAEGSHTLEASVQDLAGNAASDSFGFEVVLGPQDQDPPSLAVTSPPAVVQDDPTPSIVVEYSDLDSGVDTATLQISVDSLDLTSCVIEATRATCEPPPLGNGEHRVRAKIQDLAGNLGSVERLFEIQLNLADVTPPVVTITAPVDSIVVDDSSPEVRVEYSDADSGVDLSSFEVLMDGTPFTSSCTIDSSMAVCEPPALAQGTHELVARVEDLAGNPAQDLFNFEIQLTTSETDPPALTIIAPSGAVQDDTNPDVHVEYSDAGSGVALGTLSVEVDGTPITGGCSTTASEAVCTSQKLAAGQHTVIASIADLAGNESTSQSFFDLVLTASDTIAPTLLIESPPDLVELDRARLAVLYADGESGIDLTAVSVSLDGVALQQSCNIGLERAVCDVAELVEGTHTVAASVTDLHGNSATMQKSFTVDLTPLDLVPPNIAIVQPVNTVIDDTQPQIQIDYSDAESGVETASLAVSVNGLDSVGGCVVDANGATCTPPTLGEGTHTVETSIRDLEGNVGNAALTFDLVLTPPDITPPVLTIDEPSLAVIPENASQQAVLSFSDDASGIDPPTLRLLLDGVDISTSCFQGTSTAVCSLGFLDLGAHSMSAEISDLTGNVGTASTSFETTAETKPPTVGVVTPGDALVEGDATPEIQIQYEDAFSGVDTSTLQITLDGADLLPSCAVNTGSATCEPPSLTPGIHTLTVQLADLRGNLATAGRTFEVSLSLDVEIQEPGPGLLTQQPTVDVSGVASPSTTSVRVNELEAVVTDGAFVAAAVPLREGTNTLTAVARTSEGGVGSATVTVVRDTQAPSVVINSPPDGFLTSSSQVLITGEFNEPASSGSDFGEPTVRVNGTVAEVENRTFFVPGHLLQPGTNRIAVEVEDQAGNVGSSEITVTLLTNPTQKIEELLGNAQTATVGQTLAKPLVVRVTDGIGNPLPERLVQFEVSRGDGSVRAGTEEGRSVTVRTDDLGRAQVEFTLGERAGTGNHEVTVTSVGFPGSLVFCASAEPEPAHRIVRIQGNIQTGALVGAVTEELPKPLFTQVFDAMDNPVAGVPVTYEVVTGGGTFAPQPTFTATTDANGVATATFTLGPLPGVDVHVVKASISGGTGGPAVFNITGLEPGPESLTSVSGIVLDNQDLPVPNVTVSIVGTPLSTLSDAEGRFQIAGAPVGTVHLRADGSTTTLAGTWPVLEFEMVTISGQDNELGMPVRLLPIDPGVLVGGSADVEIPLEGVPGASLTVFANSVTFADGSKEGLVSFTQVHNDKVPMVPPLGSTFAVALTIQPAGTLFDPPAQIQIPNPGHRPGEVVDIFSFDHDLGEFVSAGTASVTPDGLFLRSNPGFGVRKAGWHGCSRPVPETDACNPGTCTVCVLDGPQPNCTECEECTGEGCQTPTLEEVTATARAEGGASSSLVAASQLQPFSSPAAAEEDELIIGVDQGVLFDALNLVGRCAGTLEWEWSFGDGSEVAMGRSASHVYDQVGTFLAQVTGLCKDCPGSGSVSDSVSVKVIELDLRLQNLPEEEDPPPNEVDPGGVIALNNDDDDQDGTVDHLDTSVVGEDDMEVLRLDVDRQINEGEVTLDLTAGSGKMKVWEEAAKRTEFSLPKTWDLASEEVPGVVWIEGIETSASEGDISFILRYENDQGALVEDEVNASVLEVDLDIDSDNTDGFNLPGRTTSEDRNEDVDMDSLNPGKYVVVNHDDDDEDGVTDFADGYNRDAALGDDDANADEMFVPLVLELAAPINVADAKIRLTYDASDPGGVTVVQVAQIPATITIPDYQKPGGHLRIWTVPATSRTNGASLKSGGQYVASDTYTSGELGFGGGRVVTLYVEALAESSQVGDQRLLVEVDPDGDSGPQDFMLQDAVRLTSVMLEIRDSAVGPQPIEGGDFAFVDAAPRMPQLVARVLPRDLRSDVIIDCALEFEFDRAARGGDNCGGAPDNVNLPVTAPAAFFFPGGNWNIAAEYGSLASADQFFGGKGYVRCRGGGWEAKHEFKIRGRNPEDAAARSFIDATLGYWFAYAIAKHESTVPGFLLERYHQFDLRSNRLYEPLLGAPDGWGMFQIDFSARRRAGGTDCLSSRQLWNWHENVRGVRDILAEKADEADDWLNSEDPRTTVDASGNLVCDTIGGNAFPHGQRPQSRITNGAVYSTNPTPCVAGAAPVWIVNAAAEPIPDHTVANCTFSETGAGDGNFEDAGTIQCFNGCNPHYVVWDGVMWDFRPNVNNYVEEVCEEVDP